jgi:hypothetical protein
LQFLLRGARLVVSALSGGGVLRCLLSAGGCTVVEYKLLLADDGVLRITSHPFLLAASRLPIQRLV